MALLPKRPGDGSVVLPGVARQSHMTSFSVADHIIDLGPDGGDAGGHILFAGSPEALAAQDTYTAHFLKEELARSAAFVGEQEEEVVDLEALAGDGDDVEEIVEEAEGEPVG